MKKASVKIKVPYSKDELHKGLDMILSTRTVSKSFGDTLLQFLWIAKTSDKATQINFSRAMGTFLDSWASEQKGAAK